MCVCVCMWVQEESFASVISGLASARWERSVSESLELWEQGFAQGDTWLQALWGPWKIQTCCTRAILQNTFLHHPEDTLSCIGVLVRVTGPKVDTRYLLQSPVILWCLQMIVLLPAFLGSVILYLVCQNNMHVHVTRKLLCPHVPAFSQSWFSSLSIYISCYTSIVLHSALIGGQVTCSWQLIFILLCILPMEILTHQAACCNCHKVLEGFISLWKVYKVPSLLGTRPKARCRFGVFIANHKAGKSKCFSCCTLSYSCLFWWEQSSLAEALVVAVF